MIWQLIGAEKFRQGTDLYFAKFDQCAVTIEDFIGCMAKVSKYNFNQFMNWYNYAGTPEVIVNQTLEGTQLVVDFEQRPPKVATKL